MAKVAVVFLCLALVQTIYALDCYNCVSTATNKCDEFADNIAKTTCGKAAANYKPACIKKVLEDKSTKTMNTTRSCVILKSDGNTDSDCKAPSDRVSVTFCEACFDDLCNHSASMRFNTLAIATGTLVSLLLAKLMH